ncbi:hypothetical protein QE152_g13328 [Popillia japonica]|uniref:Transposase n=1 Tax=Popillia japonica TaxID=7064 RepID=A0AAW1LDH9_POPJA
MKSNFDGGAAMAWRGISFNPHTELVFIEVLEDHVIPFMVVLGDNATVMHDNGRPHTARMVTEDLDFNDLLSCSEDMNPIEHVWDEMEKRLRRHVPVPRNFEELCDILGHNGTIFRGM